MHVKASTETLNVDPVARLALLARRLGPDEQAVLVLVAERLWMGRERYGELQVQTDRRCFADEALERGPRRATFPTSRVLQ